MREIPHPRTTSARKIAGPPDKRKKGWRPPFAGHDGPRTASDLARSHRPRRAALIPR